MPGSRSGPAQPAAEGKPARTGFPVVGVGGSAGALQALLQFFPALPEGTGMAFVVVLHLSPDHESDAAGILQRTTPMPVVQVTRKTLLEADHVYVIPPGLDLLSEDGHVQPTSRKRPRSPSAAIDVFFRTLADVHQEHAIGIVLSGTGSDGSVGVSRVKEWGGITIAQDPEDAEFDEMPRSAIATNTIDFILSATQIASQLVELSRSARNIELPVHASEPDEEHDRPTIARSAFSEILTLLRTQTRNDFRHYKRATVLRRLARRMQIHGLPQLDDYRDYLRNHPDEARPLLQDLLISVTNFFRDPPAFERLERLVIPKLFQSLKRGEDLRVWVAGCATGEESYSIGILLREHAEQLTHPPKLQIFASDINEEALAAARHGSYPAAISADVSQERLARYFQFENERYRVTPALRDQVLFAKHNVLTDPAFSKVDLICCRNLLIYLDSVAQKAALEMFSYALKPGGILFLGNAESPAVGSNLFVAVDVKYRIYRPNSDVARIGRTPSTVAEAPLPSMTGLQDNQKPKAADEPAALLHHGAIVALSAPSILIDDKYEVLHRSQGAAPYLSPGAGVPSHNLLDNVASDLRLELRTALFRAAEKEVSTRARVVRTTPEGVGHAIEIEVHPVIRAPDEARRWVVLFRDSSPDGSSAHGNTDIDHRAFTDRLEQENRELKAHLQDTLDRSAVSAEEYKAANEELQAINEELRSASEELETSKEELQSMNEELVTVNFELKTKVDESARTNDDLRNLMASSDIATVFVDGGLRIRRYTPQATKLFNLISSDVGRPLLDIRHRLRYDEMSEDAIAAFQQLRVIEREVDGTDERHFYVRVHPYRTAQNTIEGAVLTFFDTTKLRQAEEHAKAIEKRLRDAIELSEDFAVLTADEGGIVRTWNIGAERIFGYAPGEIIGEPVDKLFTPEDRAAGVPQAELRKARDTGRADDERWHLRKDESKFFCSGVMTGLRTAEGWSFAKIARDVSDAKRLGLVQDRELKDEKRANARAQVASDLKDEFLAVMSHELKQPLNLIQVNAELLSKLPEMQSSRSALRIGDTIQRAVGTQTKIVNDLLDLSRVRTGKLTLNPEAVDVVEVIKTLIAAMAGDAHRKKVAVEVRGVEALVCYCDHVRVEQILWNLLGNALKFTPAGGRVGVDVQQEGEFAKLAISDTGVGIAESFLSHAFDMFSQGQAGGPSNAGLGIGLSLVDALVQAHGGRIEAASEGLGHGSTFTVWLPVQAENLSDPRFESSDKTTLAGKRILVVDDDADSLVTFAMLLEVEGATVQTAESAQQALQRLRDGRFDVLISDLGMPGMGGLELIAEVRKQPYGSELKAIAVTGFGREADAARARQAGFDGHISKPASMAQIKAAIERL